MRKKIRVIQYGLGTTSGTMAKFMLEREGIEIVGAIDIDKEKVGKDIGEVLGLDEKVGVIVSDDPDVVITKTKADIMVHGTVSFAPEVWSQIAKAVEAGMNVITIAEEMAYPYVKYPKLAEEIDKKAKQHRVSVLGTGVNPGFAMDLLVLLICGVCQQIRKIRVNRLVNFSPFPAPLLRKLGIGFTVDEFNEGRANGSILTFIGLLESMSMVADGLGWKLDEVKQTIVPVLTEKLIETPIEIEAGKTYGFDQSCRGIKNGQEIIILEEFGRVGPGIDSKNTISIEGVPNIIETMNIPPSDVTAAAHVVNLIPHVLKAKPGLITMKDLHSISLH